MKICQSFLDAFIGGILFIRFPCFEDGPDWFYLFKTKITDIVVIKDGIHIEQKCDYPNWFRTGSWIGHDYDALPIFWNEQEGLRIISPGIIYLKLDDIAEVVIYTNESYLPELNPYKDFPANFEQVVGLGGVDF